MKWLPSRRVKTEDSAPPSETPKITPQKSLWNLDSATLIELIALPKPAPGGGSVAIVAGCMGTALLRKAFIISRVKPRLVDKSAGDEPLDELNQLDRVLRTDVDLDAAGFDYYIRALRLPRANPLEKKVREKAVEQALVRATSVPINAAAVILRVVGLALCELPSIEQVVITDAAAGIRLLNSSAGCLLYTAESNLRKIADAALSSILADQLEALSRGTLQAESELRRALASRAPNPFP